MDRREQAIQYTQLLKEKASYIPGIDQLHSHLLKS